MELLYFFEKIRIPVLNEFMLLITRLGEETAFLVIGLIVFWCVSKKMGYYVMSVGFLGSIASQAMKIACRVPRPWVKDPGFTILEQAREAASGYSFPSGHTQSAVGTFGAVARHTGKTWLRWTLVALAALVGISRMYIGVHTPEDVLVGAAISVACIFLLYPLMMGNKDRTYPVLIALLVISAVYLAILELVNFPADTDAHNLESAIKNSYTFVGCMLGLVIGYPIEKRFVKFREQASWQGQLLKVILGLVVVLGVKEGLRSPLETLFAGHLAARAVRYFLIVMAAGVFLAPDLSLFLPGG